MDQKVKLHLMGLSYSQLQQGAYAMILAESDGPRRIPVVIGAAEAQSIAIALEGIRTPRPLTHDLFVSFAHAFGVKLRQVFIYRFEDGIFSSELTFSDGDRTVTIDSRTSDAVALAIRTDAPIYTTEEILQATGFVIENEHLTRTDDFESAEADAEDDTTEALHGQASSYQAEPRPENYSIEQLEVTLADLIEKEDYEQAEVISRILDRKKKERDQQ